MQGNLPGDITGAAALQTALDAAATLPGLDKSLEEIKVLGKRMQERLAKAEQYNLVFKYLEQKQVSDIYQLVSQRMWQTL